MVVTIVDFRLHPSPLIARAHRSLLPARFFRIAARRAADRVANPTAPAGVVERYSREGICEHVSRPAREWRRIHSA